MNHILNNLPGESYCEFGNSLHAFIRSLLFDDNFLTALLTVGDRDFRNVIKAVIYSEKAALRDEKMVDTIYGYSDSSSSSYSYDYEYGDEVSIVEKMFQGYIIKPLGLGYITRKVPLPNTDAPRQFLYLLEGVIRTHQLPSMFESAVKYLLRKMRNKSSLLYFVVSSVPKVDTI